MAIEKGIGDKMGFIVISMAMSMAALFFAFFKGWLFSFILFGGLPVMFIGIFFIMKSVMTGVSGHLKSYG